MSNEEMKDRAPEDVVEEAKENAEDKAQEEEKEINEEAEKVQEEKEAKAEDEDMQAKYMRLMADFQNYKRRQEKERGDIYTYANEKLITELLTVLDNFERALEHESEDKAYTEGMRLIFKQFLDVLEKSGLEEIKAQGEDFDPNFHNAVMTEDNEDFESGKVTEVFQKGYLLNKKVIRPTMVKVNN